MANRRTQPRISDDEARSLTRVVSEGDTRAFVRFFHAYFEILCVEARHVTDRDDAFCLDVVQDVMIRVIRRMKPLYSEAHLRHWLSKTVRSCAIDALRKDARQRQRESWLIDLSRKSPDTKGDERIDWVRGELALLEQPELSLVAMRFHLGWTLQRIGRVLGLKPGAVDGRIHRIMARLRRRGIEDPHE